MTNRLIQLLEHLKITKKAFAEAIGLSASTITDFLKGRSKELSSSTIISMHKKFNVNPTWFLTGEGEMFLTSASTGSAQRPSGEEPSKVMQSDAPELDENDMSRPTSQKKQNGHLTGINGNVETYPEITSIEQIARTGWWANLTEDDRELYAINEELPHEATRRLRDAAEYEYLVNERRIEVSEIKKKTLRQKGEAG